MPEALAPVVPPTEALVNQLGQATSSGDPVMVRAVAPVLAGTSLEKDAKDSERFMQSRVNAVNNVVEATNAKGGIDTQDGRLEAAKKIQQEYNSLQPGTSLLKGIAAAFMGVPDPWKLATTGRTESQFQYDKFGNGAIVFYNQNNPKLPAYAIDATTKQPIDPKSFGERGFGLYADAASSPFAKLAGDVYADRKKYLENITEKANINAAAFGEIGNNAKAIQNSLEKLSSGGYGLNNEQLNEIHSLTSKVINSESDISNSMNTLRSSQDVDSRRKALETLKSATGSADIGAFSVNSKGQVTDSQGKAVSDTLLNQKVQESLRKSGLSVQYNQAREQLINSQVFKNLPTVELKADLINTMNLIETNHRLINELKISEKELPFLATSIPMKAGDPFQVGIVSSLMDQYKAEASQAFQQFFTEQSKNFPADRPPPRGEIERAFSEKVLPELRQKYADLIREAQSRKYPEAPKSQSSIGTTIAGKEASIQPVAPPTEKPPAPAAPKEKKTSGGHEKNILDLLNKGRQPATR